MNRIRDELVEWIFGLDLKPANLKLILLALAYRENLTTFLIFPSIERIAIDTGLNCKTVQAGILKLIKLGLIHDTGKRKGSTQRVRVFKFDVKTNISDINNPTTGNVPEIDTKNDPIMGMQNINIENKKINIDDFDFSKWPEAPSEIVFHDWLKTREERGATSLKQTVVDRLGSEFTAANEAGYSVDECLSIAVVRSWKYFCFSWILNLEQNRLIERCDSNVYPKATKRSEVLDLNSTEWSCQIDASGGQRS